MHRVLTRQLKRLGLGPDLPPRGPEDWGAVLRRISASYHQADQDRYTLERSLNISSREMQELYQGLERSSQTQLALKSAVLETSLATLHATFDASLDGIVVLDQDQHVVDYNRRFLDIWNITPEVVTAGDGGRLLHQVAPLVADPEPFVARVLELRAHPSACSVDEVPLLDGRILERYSAPVRLESGGVAGRVWFFRDVTSRYRYEEALREAVEAAERASQIKSEFLSNMSHEMRTPLNAILGFARVMQGGRGGALSDKQLEFVGYIERAGEHMLALINDLLDLRRLESDPEVMEPERVDLDRVVHEAVSMVRSLADEKAHTVDVALDGDLPPVLADRRAVVQILVNLLSNAIKFTPARGRIAVRAGAAGHEWVRVEVEDDGVGIDPGDQVRLFNYFEQLGAKHAHNMKGSGIGLALTRSLVDKLGGSIEVESEAGAGSTFSFTVPRWLEEVAA